MKALIWIVSLAAIGLAAAIALAGPGTQLGWWEYPAGLRIIRQAALPAMVACLASILAAFAALVGARGLLPVPLLAAILSGMAALVPIEMKNAFESNPFIHDVTTDFDNPPTIEAGADKDRVNPPEYLGDDMVRNSSITVAGAQRESFPDIRPIETSLSVTDAAALSRDIVKSMGMKLLAEGPVDEGWKIEAADKSFWFGFVDDFVVRIQPDGNGDDGGALIDLRSKSRVGGSDLGANGARALEFIERFDERAAAVTSAD